MLLLSVSLSYNDDSKFPSCNNAVNRTAKKREREKEGLGGWWRKRKRQIGERQTHERDIERGKEGEKIRDVERHTKRVV